MKNAGGQVHYTAPTGEDWTFTPSFARIEALGAPQQVVDLLASLFGANAEGDARYLLACLCDQEDPSPVLGWLDEERVDHTGFMPADLQILIARHLMQISLVGAGEALNRSEYQSILDIRSINYELTSPTWTAYMAHVKEIANG